MNFAMGQAHHLTARLISFYLGEQPDIKGRNIRQIWDWDIETLECTHDYIQWLFPLAEKSAYNPDAPIVDESIIQAFHQDLRLQQNLRLSLKVMLRFYGFQSVESVSGEIAIKKGDNYSIRKQEWIWPFDHNYLRITRILTCLMILGQEKEAQAFYNCLSQIYQEERDQIGGETFRYWTHAVEQPTRGK